MAAIVVLVTAAAVPATAQGIRPVGMGDSHCVVVVTGETGQGQLIAGSPRCFDDLSEAMGFASAGSLQPAPGAAGDTVSPEGAVAAGVSRFILGIHYEHSGGRGSSVTVVGSSCSGGYWNAPSWLANKISSSYHGCGTLTHHDLPNLGGAAYSTTGIGSTQNLPGFNDRAESVRYLP